MKKIIFLTTALLLTSFTVTSEEVTKISNSEEPTVGSTLKDGFSSLGSSIKQAGSLVTSSAKRKTLAAKLKSILGTWTFANGKAKTVIELGDNLAVTLTQSDRTSTIIWKGECSDISSSTMTVTFISRESFAGETKSLDSINEAWNITYKKLSDTEFKVISDDIPDDPNGFDFSNATLFLRPEESSK